MGNGTNIPEVQLEYAPSDSGAHPDRPYVLRNQSGLVLGCTNIIQNRVACAKVDRSCEFFRPSFGGRYNTLKVSCLSSAHAVDRRIEKYRG